MTMPVDGTANMYTHIDTALPALLLSATTYAWQRSAYDITIEQLLQPA